MLNSPVHKNFAEPSCPRQERGTESKDISRVWRMMEQAAGTSLVKRLRPASIHTTLMHDI